jgi:hypothetical protein
VRNERRHWETGQPIIRMTMLTVTRFAKNGWTPSAMREISTGLKRLFATLQPECLTKQTYTQSGKKWASILKLIFWKLIDEGVDFHLSLPYRIV